MTEPKRTKNVRRDAHSRMQDLYRTWARNRWPGAAQDVPDWSDVETAFQAGYYLSLTENATDGAGQPQEGKAYD